MSGAAYSPGPWSLDAFNEIIAGERNYEMMVLAADGESIVAQCVADHNADLIAAAPELYEALAEVFADHTRTARLSWNDKAAAALAKAGTAS